MNDEMMSPARKQALSVWARACQTFFAAVMENCGPSLGVDIVRIVVGGELCGTRPFEERSGAVVRALEYLKLQNVRESYNVVASELINFTRYFSAPEDKLPTCAELESWYSRVRGHAKDLLERRAI